MCMKKYIWKRILKYKKGIILNKTKKNSFFLILASSLVGEKNRAADPGILVGSWEPGLVWKPRSKINLNSDISFNICGPKYLIKLEFF